MMDDEFGESTRLTDDEFRDECAMRAMVALMPRNWGSEERTSRQAYCFADAMVAERARRSAAGKLASTQPPPAPPATPPTTFVAPAPVRMTGPGRRDLDELESRSETRAGDEEEPLP